MPGQVIGANISLEPLSNTRKFGVRWYKNESSTALTRLYDSVGKTFTPSVGTKAGNSGFDNEPIYRDIKLCNVADGQVTAYYGDSGFSWTPVSGDVMVEIPRYYYKIEESDEYRDYIISNKPLDDFSISPRHAPHSGKVEGYEKIYVSAYTLNETFRSISGNASVVDLTRSAARAGCAGRGAGYYQYDFATYWTISLLYLVEVANWDSQALIGSGSTGGLLEPANTGATDGVMNHTGRATTNASETHNCVKYRHIENLWGNIAQFMDGINFSDDAIYICMNPVQYADDIATNYMALSYRKASVDGFIQTLGYDLNYPWAQICSIAMGDDGTYIPDYYWSGKGWRAGFVGGDCIDAEYAGLFTLFSNWPSANTSTSVGCRLIVLPS